MTINVATAKSNNRKGSILVTNVRSSNPWKPYAEFLYDKKKRLQKEAIHKEILRVSLTQSLI